VLDSQAVDLDRRQVGGDLEFERRARACREQLEQRPQLCNDIPELALDGSDARCGEQRADATDSIASLERFVADVMQELVRVRDHGLGPAQHALRRLRKSRDRADRLIQFMRDAARHLLERRDPGDLQELFQQPRRLQRGQGGGVPVGGGHGGSGLLRRRVYGVFRQWLVVR
jgi:hypothetical protein